MTTATRPRRLTDQHKARLAAARAEATRRRQARDAASLDEFRAWLKLESGAHAALIRARSMFGHSSDVARAAHAEWRAAMSQIPQPPADAAFRRERGEESLDA